jgi:hypothetical protein
VTKKPRTPPEPFSRNAWTPDEDRLAKEMAEQGRSSREIGKVLGRSRNAILGRFHRLGVKWEGKWAKPKQLVVDPKAEPAPSPPAVFNIADYPPNRPWLERRRGECAFPVTGAGADTVSCCARTEGKGADVYCAQHREVMYVPKPPRRKQA